MMEGLNKPIRIRLWSVPAHLPIVRGAVEKACEAVGFDGREIGRIVLSVDEALANIIKHAYDYADDQSIEMELTVLGEEAPEAVEIRLRDYGRTVDPASIKSRELDDIRPGGLGVHIMTECMDTVTYEQPSEGGTLLRMVKKLSPPKEDNGT
jgi:anti-sigma regulatory factor (Ser/Thr protein kinase)